MHTLLSFATVKRRLLSDHFCLRTHEKVKKTGSHETSTIETTLAVRPMSRRLVGGPCAHVGTCAHECSHCPSRGVTVRAPCLSGCDLSGQTKQNQVHGRGSTSSGCEPTSSNLRSTSFVFFFAAHGCVEPHLRSPLTYYGGSGCSRTRRSSRGTSWPTPLVRTPGLDCPSTKHPIESEPHVDQSPSNESRYGSLGKKEGLVK